jgi:aminomuconate-semialdehyde/2-hydroxymuconate-6-semialdehyde dehydrogenase
VETIKNYIAGELVEPQAGRYLDNMNPSTGTPYSRVPDSDEADIDRAVQAAVAAFPAWSATASAQRCRVLLKLADLIDRNLDDLARAESVDNGKPMKLARSLDIPRAAANFRFFGTSALHTRSECHPMDDGGINYTLRRPRGVAGIISPWNLPLHLISWKVAPALATGNTVVAKPSEVTPMTAYKLSQFGIQAGLPPGVLNIVHGQGPKAGAALVRHADVPTVSFTGGTVTGEAITRVASPMFKKVALEMGGKNPNVIFADADIDEAIKHSLRSAFANQGQVCLCGSRMFVERSIYDSFLSRFVEATDRLRVGDPLEEDTDQGALVSKAQYDKVLSYIQLARDEGGEILCGGGPATGLPDHCRHGYFGAPTVITGLDIQCRVNQEEIFGPVVTVMPFEGEDEVAGYANATGYGLSASVWTQDISRAHRMAERIQTGTVWVNSWMIRDLRVPFGGMKRSGVGREGGEESIRFFTEPKNVCIHVPSLS